ncbi:EAL and GGDEF domain-containing protein [Caldimonas tepidiphila]|uniref:sensor domain-containing protein n=1 Tax=Caldimonas tepidiphila TaxID=2315841 RepID=UPI000E5A4281|nr:EAL domain-containing protein [Caldimonas tepidiphila]
MDLSTETTRSAEQLERLVQHVPGLIYQLLVRTDGSNAFLYVSPSVSRLFEVHPADVEQDADRLWSKVHPDELSGLMSSLELAGLQQSTWRHEFRVLTTAAEPTWMHAEASLQLLPDGSRLWHGYMRDITERKQAEQRMWQSKQLYRSLVDAMPQCVYRIDREGRMQYANPALLDLLGCDLQDVLGLSAEVLFPTPLAARLMQRSREVMADARSQTFTEETVDLRDGSLRTVEVTLLPLAAPGDGGAAGLQGVLRDITERVRHEAELRLAATVFEASRQAVVITDAEARILRVNPAFEAITGYCGAEVTGRNPSVLASGQQGEAFYRQMWEALLRDGHWKGELVNRRKSGDIYIEHLSISAVRDAEGRLKHYVGIFSDVTDRKRAEERIYYLAHHDALTGLPNRVLFHDRLAMALEACRRHGTHLAVLYLDLDRFKSINDSLGHGVGDELLAVAAQRLKAALRSTDTVCRQGGDEFIVLLPEIAHPDDAMVVAEHIVEALRQPFLLGTHRLAVSGSVGIAVYPEDGSDSEALLKHADVAMYAAKKQGRNLAQFFQQSMNEAAVRRSRIETELRAALGRDELFIVMQPLVGLSERRICGLEALVRWNHPERGLVPPGHFIEVAEDSGLIVPLEREVLRLACLARTRLPGLPADARVAVNISTLQFGQPDFCSHVEQVLAETGLAPALLELEVTERMLMNDTERVMATMHRLEAMGVRIAIDDFGTGYSSMSYLHQLPVSKLKIDMSFVRPLDQRHSSRAICQAIISMAHSLGMRTVAEGVETEEQQRILAELGCDEVQGYLHAKPMTPEALGPFVAEFNRRGRPA